MCSVHTISTEHIHVFLNYYHLILFTLELFVDLYGFFPDINETLLNMFNRIMISSNRCIVF